MKVVGLIQARMGSSRLPGKVMMPLAGIPLIQHIHHRLSMVPRLDGIVLATTVDRRNDEMVELARSLGMSIVRWPEEDDIVGRLCAACAETEADVLLKINADCPLVDPSIASDILDRFLAAGDVDFASNKLVPRHPLVYSIEIVTARALRWCDENLTDPTDREMTMHWIMEHPEQFNQVSVVGDQDNSHLDLTVDTPEDFEQVSELFDALYDNNPVFGLEAVLEYLENRAD